MTPEQLVEELRQLKPEDEPGLRDLARRVQDDARAPLRSVVRAWLTGEAQLSSNALLLLDELEELPIVPLLETPETASVERRVWVLRSVVAYEQELRDRMAAEIEGLMDDTTPVPVPQFPGPEPEEKPQPRRVCDEAYLQMRLLLNADPDPETHYLNADAFLDLPEAQRDAEIQKARTSRTWTQFQEM
jgi:hypothetical protein